MSKLLDSFADISHHQTEVDLVAYKNAGHDRIALKATEGESFKDPEFVDRWKQAKDLKLKRVCYHFLRNAYSGVKQADFFLKTVMEAGEILPTDEFALDTEDEKTPALAKTCSVNFTNRMAASSYKSGLVYSGKYYLDPAKLSADSFPIGWRNLWISDYSGVLEIPNGWKLDQIVARQYGSKISVAGLGSVDYSLILKEWLDVVTIEEIEDLFKRYLLTAETTQAQIDKDGIYVHNLVDVLARFAGTYIRSDGVGNRLFHQADDSDPRYVSVKSQLEAVAGKISELTTAVQSIPASGDPDVVKQAAIDGVVTGLNKVVDSIKSITN